MMRGIETREERVPALMGRKMRRSFIPLSHTEESVDVMMPRDFLHLFQ